MYDLIIIGAGPAGMSAAIYAARYKLKTLLISKDIGGVTNEAHLVENWPGTKSISGVDLMKNFEKHVRHYKVEIKIDEVVDIEKNENFRIITDKNESFETITIIMAMGTKRRKLNVPGEAEFLGKGISYCATCDAPFFKDKIVGVVGGSDAAAMAALYLSEYAKKVYIIYRKEKIRAQPYYVEQIEKHPNIEIINNTNVVEVKGDKLVNAVKFDNGKEFKLDGLFIEVGSVPTVALTKALGIEVDKSGYIKVDNAFNTNVEGVYAAGDVNETPVRQIVTAAGEGVVAATSAYMYVKAKKHESEKGK